MHRLRRPIAVALLLLAAGCGGIRFPDEGPPAPQSVEEFFVRCMAGFGYVVYDVNSGGSAETCCGFTTEADHTAVFEQAMTACESQTAERFSP